MAYVADANNHLDKTWQEIYDAVVAGKDVSFIAATPQTTLDGFSIQKFEFYGIIDRGSDYADVSRARYIVGLSINGADNTFACNSPDDYPVFYYDDSNGGGNGSGNPGD